MLSAFTALRGSVRMFPKFALFTAACYLAVGLAIAIPVGVHHHSASYGISLAILVLSSCILFDFLAYYAIASNPAWYARCREFADAFARIFLTARIDNTPEEPDDTWWEDDGVYEPFEPDGDHYVEGDFIEDEDVQPGDELSQVEDLDRGHEPELVEFEHDNIPADEQEPKREERE